MIFGVVIEMQFDRKRYTIGDSEWASFNGIIDEIYGKGFLPPNKTWYIIWSNKWVGYGFPIHLQQLVQTMQYYMFD